MYHGRSVVEKGEEEEKRRRTTIQKKQMAKMASAPYNRKQQVTGIQNGIRGTMEKMRKMKKPTKQNYFHLLSFFREQN